MQIKMDTTVISALIGAVVALIVAIITAIITVRGWQEENRRLIKQQQREAKLEHFPTGVVVERSRNRRMVIKNHSRVLGIGSLYSWRVLTK